MADNLTIQIGADATKLRAELEIAKAELRKFSIDARKESNAVVAAGGGVTPGLLAASANAERAAKHAAELRASMAGAHGEALSFSHRLRESAEHLESMHGRFRGGAEGFLGNIPLGGKGLAIGAGLAIGGEMIKTGLEAAETSHHIEAMSMALGVSTGQLMAWRRAGRGAGVDLDLLEKSYERLAISADKAADGQRKSIIETTKLASTDVVARGIPTKASAQLVQPSLVPEISGELLKFADARREQMIQANAAGLRQDPVPSVMTLATQLRTQLAEDTKVGRELRDAYTKEGGKVAALSRNEALDRLMPGYKDEFQKFGVSLLDAGGKLRQFGDIAAQVVVGLAHHQGPEGLRFKRETMGRGAIDPILGEHFTEQGELGGGVYLTPRSENEDVAFGSKAQKFINQAKADIAATQFQTGLAELRGTKAVIEFVQGLSNAREEMSKTEQQFGSLERAAELPGFTGAQLDLLIGKTKEAGSAARDAAGALGVILGGGGSRIFEADIPPSKFATGGYIRGPGSGTSDSILARLSNGEYVLNAAATARVGLHNLDRMNYGRYLPQFNTGGFVGSISGGSGGGTPVHIHFGDKTYETSASPSTAAALAHEARTRLMLRTGAKPSWAGA